MTETTMSILFLIMMILFIGVPIYIIVRVINNRRPKPLCGADMIRKYRGLADDGIISEAEFEKKKLDILNSNIYDR